MKKLVILMIALTGIFIASCVFDSISYCPYCGSLGVTSESDDDVYKCTNVSCGKKFGAMKL